MSSSQEDLGVGIGAVAKATGIPANTLRTWERRYAYPIPKRTEGGQRLYASDDVEHLKLVSRALAAGHRPAHVIGLDRHALVDLLGMGAMPEAAPVPTGARPEDWMLFVERLDGEGLDRAFHQAWSRAGGQNFLIEFASPFLQYVGGAWTDGRIGIHQEHVASERLRSFLSSRWAELSDRNVGARAVLATLPGERHDLGLHMVATTLALAGWRVLFLGNGTPVDAIAAAARRSRASAILISVCHAVEGAAEALAQLRNLMPQDMPVLVGGRGSPEKADCTRMPCLLQLRAWAADNV